MADLPTIGFRRLAAASVGVRGRFTREGRVAVGRFTALNGAGCRRVSVRFRARLTGTPNAARPGFPSSCDPVTIDEISLPRGDDGYEPFEQGIGCTTARGLARQWHRSPSCTTLNTPGATCSLGAATCETIPLGTWQPLARIRCSTSQRPGGATELVYLHACNGPNLRGFSFKAINLACRTARSFPFEQTLETDGPCGNLKRVAFGRPVTCALDRRIHMHRQHRDQRCRLLRSLRGRADPLGRTGALLRNSMAITREGSRCAWIRKRVARGRLWRCATSSCGLVRIRMRPPIRDTPSGARGAVATRPSS